MNNNHLHGSIPSVVGNLTRLRELNFFGNQLTGTVPDSLSNLTQLVLLYVCYIIR
jgi:Leucine-rich repeat (LRR) protein